MAQDSDPPESSEEDGADRPLGAFGALGWTSIQLLVVMLALSASAAIRPGLSSDLVNVQICFALGAAVAVYGIARVHMPSRTLGDATSLRPTHPLALLLAAAVGVAMVLPLTWVDVVIERRWPMSQEETDAMSQMYVFRSVGHKIVFGLITIAIGPFLEEVYCRGTLFRGLRLSESRWLTITLTAFAFALLHVFNIRALPYALLAGFALGALRDATGSMLPSLAAHASFNAVEVFFQLGPKERDDAVTAAVRWPLAAAGLALVIAFVVAAYFLSSRLSILAAARARDER